MMGKINKARKFDRNNQLFKAIHYYDKAFEKNELDYDDIINYVFVCLSGMDHGIYNNQKKQAKDNQLLISEEMLYKNSRQMITKAEEQFGKSNELEFLKKYIDWFYLNQDVTEQKFKEIAEKGNSDMPYFLLSLMSPDNDKYRLKANQYLKTIEDEENFKVRWIKGLMSS